MSQRIDHTSTITGWVSSTVAAYERGVDAGLRGAGKKDAAPEGGIQADNPYGKFTQIAQRLAWEHGRKSGRKWFDALTKILRQPEQLELFNDPQWSTRFKELRADTNRACAWKKQLGVVCVEKEAL